MANGFLIKLGLAGIIILTLWLSKWLVPTSIQGMISSQPHWLQFFEILIIADLGFYAAHRTFHAVPWLWNFHAIHHSIEELDWLAGARVHPVDQILTKGASVVPILAFGFSEFPMAAFAILYQWQLIFIHSNVQFDFGFLRYLLASPEFHHWHHARETKARNKNFAGQLPWLDALFGTLHMPKGEMPTKYGSDQPVPCRYAAQLLYPIIGERALQLEKRRNT